MKTYIGIDVGEKGFITVMKGEEIEFMPISGKTCYELSDFIREVKARNAEIACVIEDVHAIYGSSAAGTFSFGYNKGMLIGILCSNCIPYTLVAPKEWQSEIWTSADREYTVKAVRKTTENFNAITKPIKKVDTKKTSIKAAQRLFPSVDLRRSDKCRNIDDNKVDSLLMAEYARRKNL